MSKGGIGQNMLREIEEEGGWKPTSPTVKELLSNVKLREEEINQLAEELELIKKKLRISEQDVFRLAAEKIDLQDTIKGIIKPKQR